MKRSEPAGFLGTCTKHYSQRAVAQCLDCGAFWCSDCLAPPTSNRQPARCVSCALVASGSPTRRSRARGASGHDRVA